MSKVNKEFKVWKQTAFHKEHEDADILAHITEYFEDFKLGDPDWECDFIERKNYLLYHNKMMLKIFSNFRQLKEEYVQRVDSFSEDEVSGAKLILKYDQQFHIKPEDYEGEFEDTLTAYFNDFDFMTEVFVIDCKKRILELERCIDSPKYREIEKDEFRQRIRLFGDFIKSNFMIFYSVTSVLINEQKFILLKHLLPLAWQATRVLNGEEKAKISIFNIFSGAGKTDTVNKILEYELASNPDSVILHISASDALLRQNAERIRKTCTHKYFHMLFGHGLSEKDRSRVTQWAFKDSSKAYNYMAKTYGSAFLGASAGGTESSKITGIDKAYMNGDISLEEYVKLNSARLKGDTVSEFMRESGTGGLLVLDDPQEEGMAVTEYDRDWKDFVGKVASRARGNTKIIINQQRVHVNDLSGMIMKHMKGQYTCVRVPALDENLYLMKDTRTGNPLREYAFILTQMISEPRIFACMYQNAPMIDEGDLFTREMFHKYNHEISKDELKQIFITADTASTKKDRSDFTVLCLWGMTKHGRLYLLDMYRGKLEGLKLIKKCGEKWVEWCDMYTKKIPFYMEAIGAGLVTKQICNDCKIPVQAIKRPKKDKQLSKKIKLKEPNKSTAQGKVERAKLIIDKLELNHVWIRNDFFDEFVQECTEFTRDDTHRHDDMVDCLTDAAMIGYNGLGSNGLTADAARKLSTIQKNMTVRGVKTYV